MFEIVKTVYITNKTEDILNKVKGRDTNVRSR